MVANALEFYERYWRPAELVISNIEAAGVPFDASVCPGEAAAVQAEIEELESGVLNGWAGMQPINWGSPKQLAQFLYGTEPRAVTKGGPVIHPIGFALPPVAGTLRAVQVRQQDKEPTGGAALRYLADEPHRDPADRAGLEALLAWKDRTKLRGFWESLPNYAVSGRIHPQLGPNTETGRLSCKNPNLQQQPPSTRKAFVAPEGRVLVELDYDALEWRILGHILAAWCKDTSIIDEIKAGIDPHSATALRMSELGVAFPECKGVPVNEIKKRFPDPKGPRGMSKILNYSTIYMKSGRGLGAQLGIGDEGGESMLGAFFQARPGIAEFHRKIVTYAEATGGVRSLLGRRRPITEPLKIWSKRLRKEIYGPGGRQAANVIQNCAADIVTLAMLRVNTDPELKPLGWFNQELADLDAKLVLQIHDALLFECPAQHGERVRQVAATAMETCLDGVKEFLCPLGVSGGVGRSWATCK